MKHWTRKYVFSFDESICILNECGDGGSSFVRFHDAVGEISREQNVLPLGRAVETKTFGWRTDRHSVNHFESLQWDIWSWFFDQAFVSYFRWTWIKSHKGIRRRSVKAPADEMPAGRNRFANHTSHRFVLEWKRSYHEIANWLWCCQNASDGSSCSMVPFSWEGKSMKWFRIFRFSKLECVRSLGRKWKIYN